MTIAFFTGLLPCLTLTYNIVCLFPSFSIVKVALIGSPFPGLDFVDMESVAFVFWSNVAVYLYVPV
jgi:hypothetical protein